MCIFFIILVCIVYNYYKKSNDSIYIENFESILKDLNKKKKNKKKNNNDSDDNDSNNSNSLNYSNSEIKKQLSALKSKKTGTTFDDLFKASENMNPEKISISNMQKELSKYYNSFNKEKFKNNSKSTAESFEKFAFYKEKFFEIFKT